MNLIAMAMGNSYLKPFLKMCNFEFIQIASKNRTFSQRFEKSFQNSWNSIKYVIHARTSFKTAVLGLFFIVRFCSWISMKMPFKSLFMLDISQDRSFVKVILEKHY